MKLQKFGVLYSGFFNGMCQNAFLEVLSQKDASRNSVLEPILSGISITNTLLLLLNFGSLCAFRNFFLNREIGLVILFHMFGQIVI
jgi:hypothetical protein